MNNKELQELEINKKKIEKVLILIRGLDLDMSVSLIENLRELGEAIKNEQDTLIEMAYI